jgi:UDP-N-acetylglucosamine 2-epimerase (non-hydrolysing)
MPEEINRILTDQISDYYFVTEQSGLDHIAEEKLYGKTFFVGNTMIDTLVHFDKEIEEATVLIDYKLKPGKYILMTMHRPATVDNKEGLDSLMDLLKGLTKKHKVLFPIHPRTKAKMQHFGIWDDMLKIDGLIIAGPLDYFAFQKAIKYAKVIITDSGGIQEESTFRQVPCLTLRPNTERPSTLTLGSNTLVKFDIKRISALISDIENGDYKKGEITPLWDGYATERIMKELLKL